MAWYWIVLITLFASQLIGFVSVWIADSFKVNETMMIYGLCFMVSIPLLILTYPIRVNIKYKGSSGYYKKHGISKVALFFGKRVKHESLRNANHGEK